MLDKLLEKSRRLLIVDESTSDDTPLGGRESASVAPPTSVEISNYKWQQEMELQFDLLVETIRPYVKDSDLSAAMHKLIRKNRGIAASLSLEP